MTLKEVKLEDLNREFAHRKFDYGNETKRFTPKLDTKEFKAALATIKKYYESNPKLSLAALLYVEHKLDGYVFIAQTRHKPIPGRGYCLPCPHQLWLVDSKLKVPSYTMNVEREYYDGILKVESRL